MANTSKTGLLASVKLPLFAGYLPQLAKPELSPTTRPAPVVLRPFAGIYNPFPYGCSVLCNHPADLEARDVLKRAKDAWATEGKMCEEMEALRASMNHPKYGRRSFMNAPVPTDDWVPEELFRKYTETDSRPATPAPTLASVATKTSRRCLTPDPSGKERTLLVLDLRRSHSQETLSWRGMVTPAPLLPPPAPTPRWRAQQQVQYQPARQPPAARRTTPSPHRSRSRRSNKSTEVPAPEMSVPLIITEEAADLSPPTPRRRGLRRRGRRSKKLREGAQSPEKEFKGLDEPGETQISTLGHDRESSAASGSRRGMGDNFTSDLSAGEPMTSQDSPKSRDPGQGQQQPHKSFLHESIIQQLQRQLDWQGVESEFDLKRHTALEEAMRAPRLRPGCCGEIKQLAADLKLTPSRPELWVLVPRAFSRRSARFELPLDSRLLAEMTPLQYAREHVRVSEARKLLYNGVFNRHREDSGMENETRYIRAQSVPGALAEVMGSPLTPAQHESLEGLLDTRWEGAPLDFRSFCGVAAVCERVVGAATGLLPPPERDPRAELEVVDFESLARRLRLVPAQSALPSLLRAVQAA